MSTRKEIDWGVNQCQMHKLSSRHENNQAKHPFEETLPDLRIEA